MRGADITQESLFTVAKLDDFVPPDHPLRAVRPLVDTALKRLDGLFGTLYSDYGRASIAPEKLMRAQLLQLFYSIRSERLLMEQLRYNLLFRWFVGLAINDAVWDHSVFSKNRDRLNDNAVASEFFREVVRLAERRGLMSEDHFSVDGTLLQAWASHKSFQPKDAPPPGPGSTGPRNAPPDFKGTKRSNDTHASTSDPDARLYRKGNTGAQLSYQGHLLMENRHGLACDARLSLATGHGERDTALAMMGASKGDGGARWRPTKAMTPPTSWPAVARMVSHRMWHRTRPTGAVRSMAAPPSRWLRGEYQDPRVDRNPLRLDQVGGRHATGQTARPCTCASAVSDGRGGQQPDPLARPAGGGAQRMSPTTGKVRPAARKALQSHTKCALRGGNRAPMVRRHDARRVTSTSSCKFQQAASSGRPRRVAWPTLRPGHTPAVSARLACLRRGAL